jgi:ribosomal protein L16/L10AE
MRMGKGKGSKREWFCPIKKGTVVYEIFCKDFFLVRKGFLKCKNKMPFISKLVKSVY